MGIERVVVTGGAGFIGSHFLRLMISKHPEWKFVNVDGLTYAGNLDNVKDFEDKPNYEFVKANICDIGSMESVLQKGDIIFNFAGETHVDNSINWAINFTKTNTFGTHILLEAARRRSAKEIIHISTDEVYGTVLEGASKETDLLNPTNPYSASKAAAEMIIKGYEKTFKIPVKIARGNNNIGPFQYPEKIVPRFITNLLQDKKVPLHGSGNYQRTWIYVEDFARGVETIFEKGKIGEIYNIGTPYIASNIEITRMILKRLGKDESYIDFVKDRPFNDARYHEDITKLRSLGWNPQVSLEEAIDKTVRWYSENRGWWEKVLAREDKNVSPI